MIYIYIYKNNKYINIYVNMNVTAKFLCKMNVTIDNVHFSGDDL